MTILENIDQLEALYSTANPRAIAKVVDHITPHYAKWINASRFMVLSSIGPEGTDASPRGDNGPVVRIADPKTLLLPDWSGNNRLDSLRNIIRDDRVSLMFMVPGSHNVVRINGRAVVDAAPDLRRQFEKQGKLPKTVLRVTVNEAYFQCAKALMRADIWHGRDESIDLPSAGDFLKERDDGFDGATYDSGYADYAKERMW